jgi:hypothetical protein
MAENLPLIEGLDYYVEGNGKWVFTAEFLKRRGTCCWQGCRHCPYRADDEADLRLPSASKSG